MPTMRFIDILPAESLADPGQGWKYRALEDLSRAVCLDEHGTDDETVRAQDYLSVRAAETEFQRHWTLAQCGDDVVGMALVDLPLLSDRDKAIVELSVSPRARRQGIGTALLAWCEDQVRAAGHHELVFEASYGAVDEHPPYRETTHGTRAPQEAPCVAFGRVQGYELAQVARRSMLTLPLATALEVELSRQIAPYTVGYRLHTWLRDIPENWREPFARLRETFSRDAPNGDLAWDVEPWDAARVERHLQDLEDRGLACLVTAAESVATGELAAYTELRWVAGQACEAATQWVTVVLAAHRGHRLGMWVKLGNIDAMIAQCPTVRRIHTDNAFENSPMLGINDALGFVADGGIATLVKTLAV